MRRLSIYLNGDRGVACVRTIARAGHKIDDLFVPAIAAARFQLLADEVGATLRGHLDINDPDCIAAIARKKETVGIIAGFSTIFSRALIAAHGGGVINLHAGQLPEYRGGSSLNWQIINGEREAGLSVLRVTEGIDNGPVLASATIPINSDDDIASLHRKANAIFPKLVCGVLDAMTTFDTLPPGAPQDESRARYWLQRSDADGRIRWGAMKAAEVHNLVRAVTRPYPGAWSGDIRIWRTKFECPIVCGPPGRVAFIQGTGPYVCCSDRAILVTETSGPKLKHGMNLENELGTLASTVHEQ